MPTAIQTVTRPESRLHYVRANAATFQLVAAPRSVLIDLQSKTDDVDAHHRPEHATALLPLTDARKLLYELTAAVAQAESLSNPSAPTKLTPVPAPAWAA